MVGPDCREFDLVSQSKRGVAGRGGGMGLRTGLAVSHVCILQIDRTVKFWTISDRWPLVWTVPQKQRESACVRLLRDNSKATKQKQNKTRNKDNEATTMQKRDSVS